MELDKKLAIIIPSTVAAAGMIIAGSVFGYNKQKTGSFNPKDWSCYSRACEIRKELDKYSNYGEEDIKEDFEAFKKFVDNKGKGVFEFSQTSVGGKTLKYEFKYYAAKEPIKPREDKVRTWVLTGREAVESFIRIYGDAIIRHLQWPDSPQKHVEALVDAGGSSAIPTLPVPPAPPAPPPPPPPSAPQTPGLVALRSKKGGGTPRSQGAMTSAEDETNPQPQAGSSGSGSQRSAQNATFAAAAMDQRSKLRRAKTTIQDSFDIGEQRQEFEKAIKEIESRGYSPALKLSKIGKGKQQAWKLALIDESDESAPEVVLYDGSKGIDKDKEKLFIPTNTSYTFCERTFKCENFHISKGATFHKIPSPQSQEKK